MLKNVRIVLVNPSHPGNIGATARAMKNMGLQDLAIVQPMQFPSDVATARASGADDILQQARVTDDLTSALESCQLVFGTSARIRALERPTVTPRQCAMMIAETSVQVAILFGRERFGLTNEELSICHQHIIIPTVDEFSSLNLAAAVQVVVYELYVTALQQLEDSVVLPMAQRDLATADQVLGFYQHLQDTLIAIDFLDPKQPKMLMQRLQHLYNRAQLDKTEINILRGMLSRIDRYIDGKKNLEPNG